MQSLQISFMTLDDGFALVLSPVTVECETIFSSLLMCFGEVEAGGVRIKAEQKATKELKQKITEFVGENFPAFPMLKRLGKKISGLPENQYFLVLGEIPSDTALKLKLETYLEALNEKGREFIDGENFQEETDGSEELFGDLLKNYNISQPRNNRRTIIANAKKEDRKCRFCGERQEDGATFSNVAHAIPEALGNKNILLANECDGCNEFFGNDIEPNLIEYLDVYRAFLGVKGKGGIPTISYKNGKIINQGGIPVVVAEKINFTPDKGLVVEFESSKKFTPLKLYKALCKISLSTIGEQDIVWFNATLRWLRYGESPGQHLPKIAMNVFHAGFAMPPEITNYIRKSDDYSLPHLVSEFRIGSFIYVYVVPYSEKDKLKFEEVSEYEGFWSRFKHYQKLSGWRFESVDSAVEVTVNEVIRMNKSESA
jgi:hypothetical protein